MSRLPNFDDLQSQGFLIDPDTTPDVWWGASPRSWEEYLRFFSGVTTEIAIGEATVGNFFSRTACENIHHLLPEVRLICVLRQPVERGFSQFLHARRTGKEPVDNFVLAYQDCERRRQANWHPFLSTYETVGYYVKSLRTYFNHFSREQINIYLYDDLCSNPTAMMQDIYRFLGVDSSFVPLVSQKYNYTTVPRSRQVSKIIHQDSLLKRIVKKLIPKQLRRKLLQLNRNRTQLHPTVHMQLSADYADEIDELQELIGRDLSTWLEARPSSP
jgi:hypothetical protein